MVQKKKKEDVTVTPSCGCVFCDLNLEPNKDGFHYDPQMRRPPVKCSLVDET